MKDLYRSKDKVIAGVAGGIAKYFEIDPTLVRVAFALAFVLAGTGAILYIILMLILPMEGEEILNEEPMKNKRKEKNSIIGGLVLITLGLIFLLDNYFPQINLHNLWPLILIAIGVGLLLQKKNKEEDEEKM